MQNATIDQALRMAMAHHEAGRLGEAESIYRQILGYEANNPDARHLLGVIAIQRGQVDVAIELIRGAIGIHPNKASFHSNLANALRAKGELTQAVAEYEAALGLKPEYAEARNNLGIALSDLGRLEESLTNFQEAVRLKPDYAEAHSNLGNALFAKGDLDGAISAAREALRLNPNLAETYNNLANALRERGRVDESILACGEAIRLKPELYGPYNNLGNAFFEKGRLEESVAAYREASKRNRRSSEVYSNLGNALRELGEIEEAIECYRRALELSPNMTAHSNLIYALHFDRRCGQEALLAEHVRWARLYADPLKGQIRTNENVRSPDRRLRVGYVSRDFRVHPVGRFMLPLLANHDRASFEVYCYSSVQAPDSFTARLRGHADVWRDIRMMSDDAAANVIRGDKIDILVDLTMHGANNRLALFARKPAPVQAAYLAYPGTTGLEAIDYRITDRYLDPPGEMGNVYTEKSVYLPGSYWCYEPPVEGLGVAPLPARAAGYVTFGCLNNFCKVTDAAIEAWCEVMAGVAGSRLVLHSAAGGHRDRILERFSRGGIDGSRIRFLEKVPLLNYLKQYDGIDIALDPLPYAGGTTSCDALWMGVPLVTMRGPTALGRGGVSILSNVGLADWIAVDAAKYVSLAIEKAGDLGALAALRGRLRRTMLESPLMDGKAFAEGFEAALREMWKSWCARAE